MPATFSLVTLQLQITSLSDAMRPSRTTEGIAVGTASALMRQFVASRLSSSLSLFLRCWGISSQKMRHPRMALTSGVLDKKEDYDADELIIELGSSFYRAMPGIDSLTLGSQGIMEGYWPSLRHSK